MASQQTLFIPLLKELLTNEIGEANIPPLPWIKDNPLHYKFYINIEGTEEKVLVGFQKIVDEVQKQFYFPRKYRSLKEVFNVGYQVAGTEIQFAKTNLNILLTIMSTVVDIVKDFVNEEDPDGVFVKGSPKEIGDSDASKKLNLYKAYTKYQLQQMPSYGADSYRDGIIIVKHNTHDTI